MTNKTIKNHTNPLKINTNTLCLFLEDKLGAIERVIGIFTLRGHKIKNLMCTQSKFPNLLDMRISLNCSDTDLEKLVKVLYNQIHVLEIRLMMEDQSLKQAKVENVG